MFKSFLTSVILTIFLGHAAIAQTKLGVISTGIQNSSQYSSCIINIKNNRILYARNCNNKRYPASLTKMMTLYLTFEALKSKKIHPLQQVKASGNAVRQPKSNINLGIGQKITIRKSIHALIVKSANDASVVLAEAVAGNEKTFVSLMNKKAKSLKMFGTNFKNSNGLHDNDQYTTARDMAKLAIALRNHFPRYYHLFSMRSFNFEGQKIKGHNNVLRRYKGADGLKTGYVKASGFNLVTSATNEYGTLMGVVMGGQTARIRDDHMIALLDKAYILLKENPVVKRQNKDTIAYKDDIFQYIRKKYLVPVSYASIPSNHPQ